MKNKIFRFMVAMVAAVVLAGCNKKAETSAAPQLPKTPKAPAPEVPVPEPLAGEPAATTAVEPPSTAMEPSPAGASDPAMTPDQAPLEGKGRKLTPDEMSLLSYGLDQFKEQYKRYPRDLKEAVKSGFIRQLPRLPAGEKFQYDSKTSQIKVVKEK